MVDTSSTHKDVNGWVAVKDNDILIKDPQPGGAAAKISTDQTVSLFIGPDPIATPTEVFAETLLSIQLPFRTFPEYHCEFNISPDRCRVDLKIEQQREGCLYSLADAAPSSELVLSAHEQRVGLSAFKDEIQHEILHEIKARGITTGIEPEHILKAIETPGCFVTIARGTPALPAQNKLDYYFELPQLKADFLQKMLADPSANLTEVTDAVARLKQAFQFPLLKLCKAGEILVQRQQNSDSRPGLTVYGEILEAPEAVALPLKAADRTVIVDSNQEQAKARLEGVPSFNGYEVRVAPLERRSGCLEGGPGQIYDIKGSLLLDGSTDRQAQIWVSQHLEISGDVSHSQLSVQESVMIHGNLIQSHLSAGGDAAARMRLREPVMHLLNQMKLIRDYVREVYLAMPADKKLDDKQLFLRVIGNQFPKLQQELQSLWDLNQSLRQLHPRRTMVLKVVLANLLNLSERSMDQQSFADWISNLSLFLDDLMQLEQLKNPVYLNYVQGSQLVARGDVYIMGEGCYNSDLQVGGNLCFVGAPGYCREGRLAIGGDAWIPELGSPNGSKLIVELAPASLLKADLIYPGVELHFGKGLMQHILEPMQWVRVQLHKGQIQFDAFDAQQAR